MYAAAAVIAALLRRETTGEGAYIDLSELEVSALLIGEQVFDALCPPAEVADAAEDVALLCADGVWVMVTVDPRQAVELCGVGAGGLDVRAWAASRTREEILSRARVQGVPAGPVQDVAEVLHDPQLAARGFFRHLSHPHTGDLPVYGPIWRMNGTPAEVSRSAPLLGEANTYVLGELLGLTTAEMEQLVEDGVLV